MRILGIDPGTATIGFGVIEWDRGTVKLLTAGHISTSKTLSTAARLAELATDLKTLCAQWKPDTCAVEELFFSKNVTTALKVSQARGVILHTLHETGYPVAEYNPLQIKVAVTGDGRADKKQVQKMVKMILKLNTVPKPDDAADALAIALCHAQNMRFQQATKILM